MQYIYAFAITYLSFGLLVSILGHESICDAVPYKSRSPSGQISRAAKIFTVHAMIVAGWLLFCIKHIVNYYSWKWKKSGKLW